MSDAESTEGIGAFVQDEQPQPTPAVDAGAATASEQAHEQKPESGINQDAVNKRINQITAEKYQFKTEAQKAREEAEELRRKLAEIEAAKASPIPVDIAPPSPDLYYEDPSKYNMEMARYQAKLAETVVQQQSKAAQEAERLRQQEEYRIQSGRAAVANILKSAEEIGLDIDEVNRSAEVLASRGINPSLTDMVAGHEQSAALIDYLAKNPVDFQELNEMRDPLRIIRKLDSLQPEALKRKISNAPEPQTLLKGSGVNEPDELEKLCPGAKFI